MTVGIMELPPEGVCLRGVTLAGDPNRGMRTVPGLELVFSVAGITILESATTPERLLEWPTLDAATCSETLALADGSTTTVMTLVSAGRSVEFLLPSSTVSQEQVDFLRAALPIWLARYTHAPAGTGPALAVAPAPRTAEPPPPGPTTLAGVGTVAPIASPGPGAVEAPLAVAMPPAAENAPVAQQAPPAAPALWDVATAVAVSPHATGTPPGSRDHPDAGAPAPGSALGGWEAEATDEPRDDPGDARPEPRRTRRVVLLVVLLAVVVAAGAVYLVRRHDDQSASVSPAAAAAGNALATSVNLRLADLPSGWSVNDSAAPGLPAATPVVQDRALRTLASCVGQPVADLQGWFGTAGFPDQVGRATSPTFAETPAAAVRMSSTTSVLSSSGAGASLAAPFASPRFGTCLGQYQVAAVATPITAQVQPVPLTTPAGVKAYGYVTTYTTTTQSTEMVGTAFIVDGRIATLIEPTATGTAIPSADFAQAYNAVVARVARASS